MTTTAAPSATTIQKKILIHAPRSRVWHALTTTSEFSKWFSVQVEGPFVAGKRLNMLSTYPHCTGNPSFYVTVERMEPEHTFSWRWHPGAANKESDETTQVEFHLEEVDGGTMVTVTESGFDRIDLARRAKAFEENTRGWQFQLESLRQYASEAA
ncbi:MAG: SRPBCC family protein [Acidobacteriaceae bacterium]|nr:SRPBCC family protein [Acidobacteriaceae bacterium]